jgi:iron-sulfur cluster repair protein YtfE (RIC family)
MPEPLDAALSLDLRKGLPPALQVLLRDYPRDAWEADPGFHGLISFWLERHQMFRQLMAAMQSETRQLLDGNSDPAAFAARLSRYGGMFVQQLHGHHQIEDHHYFPVLATRDPRISQGFEILDSDHDALDGHLDGFVKGANAVLQRLAEPAALATAAGRFEADLTRLDAFLDRHLTDEEDLIVPVLLKYGHSGLG